MKVPAAPITQIHTHQYCSMLWRKPLMPSANDCADGTFSTHLASPPMVFVVALITSSRSGTNTSKTTTHTPPISGAAIADTPNSVGHPRPRRLISPTTPPTTAAASSAVAALVPAIAKLTAAVETVAATIARGRVRAPISASGTGASTRTALASGMTDPMTTAATASPPKIAIQAISSGRNAPRVFAPGISDGECTYP